jgi:aminoglycoside phosphotransferase (APT) family kinase protein
MPVWDAEVAIEAELVSALLREQFPELDAGSVRLLGEGWDNSVWLVEERWAFRFPRREIAIPGVERELVVLPILGPLLSVPIPIPNFVGRPSELYRWPFFGAPLLPGRELADARLAANDRVSLGAQLGRFLRALHNADVDTALPIDPNRRADMPARVEVARGWLEELGIERDEAERLFEDALQLRPADGEVVVHGDLHVRHVLVDKGALSGVIDWGDVCRADPCVDLTLVWSFLPDAGREAFLSEYGPIDEERRLRARTLAVSLCAALVAYSRHMEHASLERECLDGLERALAG